MAWQLLLPGEHCGWLSRRWSYSHLTGTKQGHLTGILSIFTFVNPKVSWFGQKKYMVTALAWTVSPKRKTQNVTLFGMIFIDVRKVRISKWGHSELGWALNPIRTVLIRDRKEVTEAQGRRLCHHRGREWRGCCHKSRNVKGRQWPAEAKGEAWNILLTVSGRNQPCQDLDLGFRASWVVRKYISVVLSCPVCTCYMVALGHWHSLADLARSPWGLMK